MPHIHNNPGEHDPTASSYIVRLDTPEPTLMLHKHLKLGVWLQFGGHVELGENPWQAIAHELREESGYELSQLKVLQPPHRIQSLTSVALHPTPIALQTHGFPGLEHYHTDLGFGFVTDQEPLHKPDDRESSVIELFTLEQLQNLPSKQIPENVVEIGKFVLTESLKHWEQIPSQNWTLESPVI